MSKFIAILEPEPDMAASQASWLDDRLYMYESVFALDPKTLIRAIRRRLEDVLVLYLGAGPTEVEGRMNAIADFLLSQPEPFPILTDSGSEIDAGLIPLIQRGWDVKAIGPSGGPEWVGEVWYPALKRSLRNLTPSQPERVLDGH